MRVRYSNTWLAAGGLQGTHRAQWDGQQVNDEAAFFRAAAAGQFARGGRRTRFAFGVWRFFSSERAAIVFAATHAAQLPLQAALTLYSDTSGDADPSAQLLDAVVDSIRVAEVRGRAVRIEYSFLGGVFSTDEITLPSEDDLVKRGVVNLSEGDEVKEVTFAQPFATAPVVSPGIQVPSGGYVFDVVIRNVTASGFEAVFGAMVPGPNYKLHYIAILP